MTAPGGAAIASLLGPLAREGSLSFWLAEGELGRVHPSGRLEVGRGVASPHAESPHCVSYEVATREHGSVALVLLVRAYLHLTRHREWARAPPGRCP